MKAPPLAGHLPVLLSDFPLSDNIFTNNVFTNNYKLTATEEEEKQHEISKAAQKNKVRN